MIRPQRPTPGLLEALGYPCTLETPWGTLDVRELTLGGLWDLQRWVAETAPLSPIPLPDDPALAAMVHVRRLRWWPPDVLSPAAPEAVGVLPWLARLLYQCAGCDEEHAVTVASWMLLEAPEMGQALERAAFGCSPLRGARSYLALLTGRGRNEHDDRIDWPKLIARVCGAYHSREHGYEPPRLTPTDLMPLPLSQFWLLVSAGSGYDGSRQGYDSAAAQLARDADAWIERFSGIDPTS